MIEGTKTKIAKKEKVIFHMDGDAFFVGVEIAKNPKLKGKPVVTGEDRGIVTALSYEAKALGIVRGMPIFKLKKEFPNVLILSGDYKSYVEYSEKMFDIVRRYADDVEEYSIDECFADLTGLERTLKMTHREIAERVKKEIKNELGISVSIGLAPTKCLAKVASKWQKPNGLTVILSNEIKKYLIKVPVEKIWGIGPKTSAFLQKKGVKTGLDFIEKKVVWIKQNLSQPYEVIWNELQGIYLMEIDSLPKNIFSSVQKTRSFHPATNNKIFLLSQFSKHIEDACAKARHYHLMPKKISFFLKDKNFKYSTYSASLLSPTNSPEIIYSLLDKSFNEIHKAGVLYKTTGVVLNELIPDSVSQGDLFGNNVKANKFETIHKQIDIMEEKFGKKIVYLASTHNAFNKKKKGTDADDLDRNLLFL